MGIKERKEREKSAKRKTIMEAAKKLFFQKGFSESTMDQIAETSEMAKGSLYLHFKSKEELYLALHLEGLDILYQRLHHAAQTALDWETKIRHIADAYYVFFKEHPEYFKLIFFIHHEEIYENRNTPAYRECIQKGQDCLSILAQVIQSGIQTGQIVSQNPMDLAIVSWGALNGIIALYEEKDHMEFIFNSLDNLIRIGLDTIIDGLKRR